MKDITKITYLLLGLMLSVPLAAQKTYYMDPEGSDSNPGTSDKPFATLVKVQEVVVAGDVVYINPGTYVVPANQVPMTTTNSGLYHCVFHMNKSGEAGKPISYLANPNKQGRPIFDLSQVKPKDQRITVFYVTGSNLYLKGFDVIGTQVTITGHTQSECFRIVKGANNNKFEDLRTHDGMAIGFYLLGGSNNHILNCDAYNNYDSVSEGGKGGNVDGFGGHINSSSVGEGKGTGNVFEGCRAWYNSDDGFDLIKAQAAYTIEDCWAFYNGYKPGGFVGAGDGTGFKAGGYGMRSKVKMPNEIPHHVVKNCLAYKNKNKGFYANHHLGGISWFNNTGYQNPSNFCMLNRKSAGEIVDVDGYDHIIRNNLSYKPRAAGKHIVDVNREECTIINNSFLPVDMTVGEDDFVSLDPAQLTLPRKADGSLPDIDFLKLKRNSKLYDAGIGFQFSAQNL